MLGLKSTSSAPGIMSGIEMIHMMRKQQSKYAGDRALSLYEQFNRLAA
jgi:transposase-like protein